MKKSQRAGFVYIEDDLADDLASVFAHELERLEHLLQRHKAFLDFLGPTRPIRKPRKGQ